jgi:small GTP-binding protein
MSVEVGEIKVVLIGATSVGKTCIVKRGTTGTFDMSTMPTLGASYTSKLVAVGDSMIRLLIWDTAGQERYRGITPMYYRNAAAVIIVYSIADRDSFNEIDVWVRSVQDNIPGDVLFFLVGNKSDLDDSRHISVDQGQEKASAINASFSETSAKDGTGIDELFVIVGSACFDKLQDKLNAPRAGNQAETIDVTAVGNRNKVKGCC